MPASPEDVVAYLEDRSESGARPSTLRVAAAIARNHKDAGFHVLDLNCYLAIRKTAHKPRWGRGGRLERTANARRRGALDVAMIRLMRDARLRVRFM